ncbi:hypothetical protein CNECB9_4040012 [Cupriavidus necator]|uniref:Extra-cytoplasmic solute receptor n=1 Tax=Cupriavidus necator TaxID=106590 RepID=A0A1K0JEZ0_CUPNE|nr:hypothetical protein CNECB9_4040012 [Cupriavidus necator]
MIRYAIGLRYSIHHRTYRKPWNLAPAGTPKAVIDKLSLEINKIAQEKSTADSLAAQGAIPLPGASADYARLVRFETQRWGEVIKKANISLD